MLYIDLYKTQTCKTNFAIIWGGYVLNTSLFEGLVLS